MGDMTKYVIEIPDQDEMIMRNDGFTARSGNGYVINGDVKNLKKLDDVLEFGRANEAAFSNNMSGSYTAYSDEDDDYGGEDAW